MATTRTKAALKKWEKGIEKPIRWSSTTTAVLTPVGTGNTQIEAQMRARILSEDFWLDMLDAYMADVLIPEMTREWKQRERRPEFFPQTIEVVGSSDALDRAIDGEGVIDNTRQRKSRGRRRSDKAEMLTGMRELFSTLTKKVPVRTGQFIGRGLGPMQELLGYRLSRYMPFSRSGSGGKSRFNTLWYAVEFGTGIFAGSDDGTPGASQYIREEGPTKDPRGGQYRGSWWLPQVGKGIHWAGQAGFHFLHDARTREPKEKWTTFLRDTLQDFIQRYVRENAAAYRAL